MNSDIAFLYRYIYAHSYC